jgi:hypothetical protein
MSLSQWKDDVAYLDACRAKRNHVEYDYVEAASAAEAAELLDFAKELREEVVGKLSQKYPGLGQKADIGDKRISWPHVTPPSNHEQADCLLRT